MLVSWQATPRRSVLSSPTNIRAHYVEAGLAPAQADTQSSNFSPLECLYRRRWIEQRLEESYRVRDAGSSSRTLTQPATPYIPIQERRDGRCGGLSMFFLLVFSMPRHVLPTLDTDPTVD